MENANAQLARRMIAKSVETNDLQKRVLRQNLTRRRADWVPLDHNYVQDFPIFDLDFL